MGFRTDDSAQAGGYRQWGSQNDYALVPGVCVLPLAEDPPTDATELGAYSPVVVLRLHAPYRLRSWKTKSDKANTPPVSPSPQDIGAFVFVGGTLQIGNTVNTTYRNFDWEVGTAYTYVENCVSRIEDGFVLGLPPFTWQTSALNASLITPATPQVGAVAQSGSDARIGYAQGQAIVAGPTGVLRNAWAYNVSSYYPGTLFSDTLSNAGEAPP